MHGNDVERVRSGREIVLKRCCGSFRHQLVAEHAGFFARRLGREAMELDQKRGRQLRRLLSIQPNV